MLKIRRSCDRLIFNMGIPIPGKNYLYIETGPGDNCVCMSCHRRTTAAVAFPNISIDSCKSLATDGILYGSGGDSGCWHQREFRETSALDYDKIRNVWAVKKSSVHCMYWFIARYMTIPFLVFHFHIKCIGLELLEWYVQQKNITGNGNHLQNWAITVS